MDGDGTSLVIALIALIFMSGYFSSTETAFTCFNKIRIKNLAQEGSLKAKQVLDISSNYDKLLSTILIGNNIVNILSATLATILFTKLYGSNGPTVSTIVMTIIVLIFGEITPKSLAKKYPEAFVLNIVGSMRIIYVILIPLNAIFSLWKKILDKIFTDENGPSYTEDELKTIIDEVEYEGVLNNNESKLIKQAIDFDDVPADDIYTPRTDIVAVEIGANLAEIRRDFINTGFSRLPIYKDTIDHIVGVIHEKDFIAMLSRDESDLKAIAKDVLFVTPNKKISLLLKDLQKNKTHMAIVIDEYGGTEGLITIEDIVEELVGEIWDEHEEEDVFFKKISNNNLLISCSADIEDMLESIGRDPSYYDKDDVSTVNGLILNKFEKIPKEGESIIFDNLKVTIKSAEEKKVDEIYLEVLGPAPEKPGRN